MLLGKLRCGAKQVSKRNAPVKKPKAEDINKLVSRAQTGFAKMGTGANAVEQQSMAQGLVSAGAGEAFSDIGLYFGDITVLGAKDIPEEEEEAPELRPAGARRTARSRRHRRIRASQGPPKR